MNSYKFKNNILYDLLDNSPIKIVIYAGAEYNPIDIKWISIKDLGNDGVFIFKTSEYLTREAVQTFNIPVIPKDTVVLSFKMTVGRVAITAEDMLSNEAIAHFKFNNKTPFTKEFLYLFLKPYFRFFKRINQVPPEYHFAFS